jgi:hypothetical protein
MDPDYNNYHYPHMMEEEEEDNFYYRRLHHGSNINDDATAPTSTNHERQWLPRFLREHDFAIVLAIVVLCVQGA